MKISRFFKLLFSWVRLAFLYGKNKVSDLVFRRVRLKFDESSPLGVNDIYYINLDSRKDRKSEFTLEMSKLGVLNYNRFSAVKDNPGGLGCSRSHQAVLEIAIEKNLDMVLICEDDCEFLVDSRKLATVIREFIANSSLDVLCIGNYLERRPLPISKLLAITDSTQTMSCYLIKKQVLIPLKKLADDSVTSLQAGNSYEDAALDQTWKSLQKQYVFAVPKERLMRQRKSYSDLLNEVVDYGI